MSEEFAPPISFRPVVGAVLMLGEEEIREVAMVIVRYSIINGIEDSGPNFASATAFPTVRREASPSAGA